jgi:hypothetical protein
MNATLVTRAVVVDVVGVALSAAAEAADALTLHPAAVDDAITIIRAARDHAVRAVVARRSYSVSAQGIAVLLCYSLRRRSSALLVEVDDVADAIVRCDPVALGLGALDAGGRPLLTRDHGPDDVAAVAVHALHCFRSAVADDAAVGEALALQLIAPGVRP